MPRRVAKNIVGPHVRHIREAAAMSQEALAARCQRFGWDISRDTVASIELQRRCVTDVELVTLADILNVHPSRLLIRK